MKLITEELKQRFKEVGSQEKVEDPIVIARFFDPCGSATWLATEYDETNNICFGYVTNLIPSSDGMFDEWGNFSIDELESIERPFGLNIERNLYCDEQPISKLVPKLERSIRLKQLEKLNNVPRSPKIKRKR